MVLKWLTSGRCCFKYERASHLLDSYLKPLTDNPLSSTPSRWNASVKTREDLDLDHWRKLIEESIHLYRRAPQTARCIWLLTYGPHQGQGTMRHLRHEPCWRGPILFLSISLLARLFLSPFLSYSMHSFFITSSISAFLIRPRLFYFSIILICPSNFNK